jgi:hypothetical protein
MASSRGILNIQSLNELTSEKIILHSYCVVTGVSYSNDSEHPVTAAAHFFDLGGRATCSHYSGNYLIGFEHCVTDYRARRVFGVPARRQLSTRTISFSQRRLGTPTLCTCCYDLYMKSNCMCTEICPKKVSKAIRIESLHVHPSIRWTRFSVR